MAQAGQHIECAEAHVVLHVDTQCLHLTITERIGGGVLRKGGGRGLTAVGVGPHAPQVHACRQQVLRMHLPVGLHVQTIGGKGHVGECQVTTQAIGVTVDGALHFLAVDAHVQVHRHAARTLQAVAHLVQTPILARRMEGDAAHPRVGVRARAGRIPEILVFLVLHRGPQLLAAVDAEAVLADDPLGLVTGTGHLAVRRVVVVVMCQRSTQHQRMVLGSGVEHGGAIPAPAGGIETRSATRLQAGPEAGLRQLHIDDAAQGAGAIQHRGRPLDHLDTLSQPQRHERGHGPHRLGRVEAHAIDQQHDGIALQAANDRVLPLGTVAVDRKARLVAQRLTHVLRLTARQLVPSHHGRGHRRALALGRVALGGDGDTRQGGIGSCTRLGGRNRLHFFLGQARPMPSRQGRTQRQHHGMPCPAPASSRSRARPLCGKAHRVLGCTHPVSPCNDRHEIVVRMSTKPASVRKAASHAPNLAAPCCPDDRQPPAEVAPRCAPSRTRPNHGRPPGRPPCGSDSVSWTGKGAS